MIDLAARRAYFDDYGDTIEELPPSLVRYGLRLTCAECGYPALDEHKVCVLCRSKDDSVKREVIAAFDEMPATPMRDHERLWSVVATGMEKLH